MTEQNCRSCGHAIDAAAKICPYCGADPSTGEKVDVKPLIETHFPPRARVSPIDRAFQFLRARQGLVITAAVVVAVLLFGALHQFVSRRNSTDVSEVPAVSLTEVTDLKRQTPNSDTPAPEIPFAYDGNPKTMQTYLAEPGAIAPPQPAAATPPAGVIRPGTAPVAPHPGVAIPRAPAATPPRH